MTLFLKGFVQMPEVVFKFDDARLGFFDAFTQGRVVVGVAYRGGIRRRGYGDVSDCSQGRIPVCRMIAAGGMGCATDDGIGSNRAVGGQKAGAGSRRTGSGSA